MKAAMTTILLLLGFSANAQQFRLQKILIYNSTSGPVTGETRFYYPGNRGSNYKNGIINYDSATTFNASGQPLTRYEKTYDTADRILTDNIEAVSTLPYYKVSYRNYTYDSLGRLEQGIHYTGEHQHGNQQSIAKYTYNTDNTLSEVLRNDFASPAMSYTSYKVSYSYDSLKNRVSVQEQALDTATQQYINVRKDTFIYDNNNHLTEHIYEEWADSNWQKRYKYNYTYTGGNVKPAEVLVSYYDTGANPYGYINYIISYNTLNDTAAIIMQLYKQSSFINFSKAEYLYNVYDQPDKIIDSRWDTTNSTWNAPHYVRHFIYEIYWPTGIPAMIEAGEPIKIYPNPATNTIKITMAGNTTGTTSITIYDLQGRLVKSATALAAQLRGYELDVSALVPGNYMIKLSGHDLQTSATFSIIR